MTSSTGGPRSDPGGAAKRILEFHREGLPRFAAVIDGSLNHDALLAHKLKPDMLAEFSDGVGLEERRARAVALAEEALRRRSKVLLPAFAGFACDGRTSNNLREFEFFERVCAPLGIRLLPFNYGMEERVAGGPLTSVETEAIERILSDLRDFYGARPQVKASFVHQQILYSTAFFQFFRSFTAAGAVLPVALVQANDHSPARVALSMVMKGLGVPRIYVQHAEVTPSFPQLDFEVSVLRNRRSLSIYQGIGPIGGRAFVIPREAAAPPLDLLAAPREEPVRVVIYPTSRVLADALGEVVDRLARNPRIREVLVKQHPGAAVPLDRALKGSGAALIDEIPSDDHVALVGNSSIVIELLARGIPVYQNFDFDPVERDYYGFVRSGLASDVALAQLQERFWTPYIADDRWLGAFSDWVQIDAETNAGEKAAFLEEMARLTSASRPPPARRALTRRLALRLRSAAKRGVRRAVLRGVAIDRHLPVSVLSSAVGATSAAGACLSDFAYLAGRFLTTHGGLSFEVPPARPKGFTRSKRSMPLPARRFLSRRLTLRMRSAAGRGVRWVVLRGAAIDRRLPVSVLGSAVGATNAAGAYLSDLGYRAGSILTARGNLPFEAPPARRKGVPESREAEIELLTLTLSEVADPARWLRRNEELRVFPATAVIHALESMIEARNPAFARLLAAVPFWPRDSITGTWLYLKRSDRADLEIPAAEIEDIARYIAEEATTPRERQLLEAALLPVVITYGDLEQIGRLFNPDRLPFSRKLQVLRRYRHFPGCERDADELRRCIEAGATGLERLKLDNAEFLDGRAPSGWSHRAAETRFVKVAPRIIAGEFETHIRPVYDALRPRMRYMEVRTDETQRRSLLDLARNALMAGEPFSTVRLSDGEAYLFRRERFFSETDVANRERHWWGTELPPDLRTRIVEEARAAVLTADVVGIPSIYRLIRDTSDRSLSLLSRLQGRGLLEVLSGVAEAAAPSAHFSEDKVNVGVLLDLGVVQGLAAAAERVVVVSSIRSDHLPSELRDHPELGQVTLPTHHRTRLNDRYAQGDEILPNVYPALLDELEARCGPRTLVLVAGGIVGKIFIGRARAAGAVALDIGHVIDDWINPRLAKLR